MVARRDNSCLSQMAQIMRPGVPDLTNEELQLCKKAFAQFDKDGERPALLSVAAAAGVAGLA